MQPLFEVMARCPSQLSHKHKPHACPALLSLQGTSCDNTMKGEEGEFAGRKATNNALGYGIHNAAMMIQVKNNIYDTFKDNSSRMMVDSGTTYSTNDCRRMECLQAVDVRRV